MSAFWAFDSCPIATSIDEQKSLLAFIELLFNFGYERSAQFLGILAENLAVSKVDYLGVRQSLFVDAVRH